MGELKGFCGEARKVIRLANEEARSLQRQTICLKDVTAGLVANWDSEGCKALKQLGLTQGALIHLLVGLTRTEVSSGTQPQPYDDEVLAMIRSAGEKAAQMGDSYIGTEHILLGILDQQNSVVTMFNQLGATLGKTEAIIFAIREQL